MDDQRVAIAAAQAEAQRQRMRADNAVQAWANAAAQRDTLAAELRKARQQLLAERNRADSLERRVNDLAT